MRSKNLYHILIFGIIMLFMTACSSSSNSRRYQKPDKPKEESTDNSVRFTSKEKKGDERLTTNNIPEEVEFDVPPVEEYPIDTKAFVDKYDKLRDLSTALTQREKILFEIVSYLETPYQYGGNTREGIDCSAFTSRVFNTSIGLQLPRTASQQFQQGNKISSKQSLEFGDLVFFNTSSRSYPGHVGIYIGEDLFAHASRSLGVTISSLQSSYYAKRFVGGRRIK